jgi:hypothetical protein
MCQRQCQKATSGRHKKAGRTSHTRSHDARRRVLKLGASLHFVHIHTHIQQPTSTLHHQPVFFQPLPLSSLPIALAIFITMSAIQITPSKKVRHYELCIGTKYHKNACILTRYRRFLPSRHSKCPTLQQRSSTSRLQIKKMFTGLLLAYPTSRRTTRP